MVYAARSKKKTLKKLEYLICYTVTLNAKTGDIKNMRRGENTGQEKNMDHMDHVSA